MTTENQRLYLDELSRRWQKSPDEILKMAAKDKLELWFEFRNVIVQKVKKKKKNPAVQLVDSIELRLPPDLIGRMIGRTDRIQVAAEYTCLTPKGKEILISNAAGEEWGETSMVGLNPMRLYAPAEGLSRIERKQDIVPFGQEAPGSCCCQSHREEDAVVEDDGGFISADHPCFAPELHIALECWLELMGEEEEPDTVQKADILTWIRGHYPELTKTATERIAMVVTPAAKQKQ